MKIFTIARCPAMETQTSLSRIGHQNDEPSIDLKHYSPFASVTKKGQFRSFTSKPNQVESLRYNLVFR